MKPNDFLTEVISIILGFEDDNKKPIEANKEIRKMEENKIVEAKKDLKLSSPWVTYVNELGAMFGKDPEIKIQYDEAVMQVKLLISNQRKYEALQKLLPAEKAFGNVVLKITLVPANIQMSTEQILRAAFEGNPAFSQVITVSGVYDNPITYVMFEKEAVQYWNDNMGDPHGVVTTLYQDIAERLFNQLGGVVYSTESDQK